PVVMVVNKNEKLRIAADSIHATVKMRVNNSLATDTVQARKVRNTPGGVLDVGTTDANLTRIIYNNVVNAQFRQQGSGFLWHIGNSTPTLSNFVVYWDGTYTVLNSEGNNFQIWNQGLNSSVLKYNAGNLSVGRAFDAA